MREWLAVAVVALGLIAVCETAQRLYQRYQDRKRAERYRQLVRIQQEQQDYQERARAHYRLPD